jgi:hypothetical protein
MGARGPLSKASRGQVAYGHAAKSAKAKPLAVIAPAQTTPTPPQSLGTAGIQAWNSAYKTAIWLGTEADQEIVTGYARLRDEEAELRSLIDTEGRTTPGSMGQTTDHPHVTQLRAVENSIYKALGVLGLGPVNSLRIGVQLKALQEAPESALEQLMAKRRGAA